MEPFTNSTRILGGGSLQGRRRVRGGWAAARGRRKAPRRPLAVRAAAVRRWRAAGNGHVPRARMRYPLPAAQAPAAAG